MCYTGDWVTAPPRVPGSQSPRASGLRFPEWRVFVSEKHLARILNVLLDLDQELDGLPAVQQTVVVREGEVHHGTDLDLTVDSNGTVLGGVEAEDGRLGKVDDGGTHQGAKDAAVADGESAASHIFDRELAVASLYHHS